MDAVVIKSFWKDFSARVISAGPESLSGFEQAASRLSDLQPALRAEFAAVPGGIQMTISAQGVFRYFPLVYAVAAAAPAIPGLYIRALRPVKALPGALTFGDVELPAARMRVHAVPVLARYGVLLLTSGVKITDFVLFRNHAQRMVMDMLGEERFGSYVTDVQVMDHADWDQVAQGEGSEPLAGLLEIIPRLADRPQQPDCDDSAKSQDNMSQDNLCVA